MLSIPVSLASLEGRLRSNRIIYMAFCRLLEHMQMCLGFQWQPLPIQPCPGPGQVQDKYTLRPRQDLPAFGKVGSSTPGAELSLERWTPSSHQHAWEQE